MRTQPVSIFLRSDLLVQRKMTKWWEDKHGYGSIFPHFSEVDMREYLESLGVSDIPNDFDLLWESCITETKRRMGYGENTKAN